MRLSVQTIMENIEMCPRQAHREYQPLIQVEMVHSRSAVRAGHVSDCHYYLVRDKSRSQKSSDDDGARNSSMVFAGAPSSRPRETLSELLSSKHYLLSAETTDDDTVLSSDEAMERVRTIGFTRFLTFCSCI